MRNLSLTGIADSQSSALFRNLALLSEIMAESKHSSSLPQFYHQKKLSSRSLSHQREHIFPGMHICFRDDGQGCTNSALIKLVLLEITPEQETVQLVGWRPLTGSLAQGSSLAVYSCILVNKSTERGLWTSSISLVLACIATAQCELNPYFTLRAIS